MKTLLFSLSCLAAVSMGAQTLPLIPYPQEVTRQAGTFKADPNEIHHFTVIKNGVREMNMGESHIRTTQDATLGAEGYRLQVDANGIRITYNTPVGLFYAQKTLSQLARTTNYQLPFVTINDAPQFRHRGFMLDEARYFFGKEEVKKVLDIMAAYKLNRFHWHLTDDQGWRVHIPEYPRLTEVGAVRRQSLISRGTQPFFYDDTEYGRGKFYTLDDLREIVEYARQRHIEIIPEIDLPGHMVAVLTAYPEFSCDPTKKYEVRSAPGVAEDVLNVGDDKAIAFLKTVLGHIASTFPGKQIHIGGDECPTKVWKTNALCLQRVKDKNLKGVEELQAWLVQELGQFLKEKYGKDIIVWDELLDHWPERNSVKPTAMAWRDAKHAVAAANKGMSSVIVPVYHNYLDLMQVRPEEARTEEVYQGGYSDYDVNRLDYIYRLNPLQGMEGKEAFVLGTQVNLWAETLRNAEQLEYCLLPRLLASAEVGWLPAEKKNWENFLARLQSHDEFFEEDGYTYAPHFFQKAAPAVRDSVQQILKEAQPGKPGYPSKKAYKLLQKAMKSGAGLPEALNAFKAAPVTQPEAGVLYTFRSASTFYKLKYAGSTMYAGEKNVRAHFTPQNTREEVWTFVPRATGFMLRNENGKFLRLGEDGKPATLESTGTVFFINKATKAFRDIHYVHGAVTFTDAAGNALYIGPTADVISSTDVSLACPATWRIVRK